MSAELINLVQSITLVLLSIGGVVSALNNIKQTNRIKDIEDKLDNE